MVAQVFIDCVNLLDSHLIQTLFILFRFKVPIRPHKNLPRLTWSSSYATINKIIFIITLNLIHIIFHKSTIQLLNVLKNYATLIVSSCLCVHQQKLSIIFNHFPILQMSVKWLRCYFIQIHQRTLRDYHLQRLTISHITDPRNIFQHIRQTLGAIRHNCEAAVSWGTHKSFETAFSVKIIRLGPTLHSPPVETTRAHSYVTWRHRYDFAWFSVLLSVKVVGRYLGQVKILFGKCFGAIIYLTRF